MNTLANISGPTHKEFNVLVINPNSSESVTKQLIDSLGQHAPPNVKLSFCNPDHGPANIMDQETSKESAAAAMKWLRAHDDLLQWADGFLVCCFSKHPLVDLLQDETGKPTTGIFEAAVTHAMLIGKRFGIVTTGQGWKQQLKEDVEEFLGAKATDRLVGVEPTELHFDELQEADSNNNTTARMVEAGQLLAKNGADVIVLGCAGKLVPC
jgi:Asp/Glu/hydantoin racemase